MQEDVEVLLNIKEDTRTCLGCGGEYGPMIVRNKQTSRRNSTGLKIEENREKRNGVTRPSAGGKCRAVWDALDDENELPSLKRVRELAILHGWNSANAVIELYHWRKFNSLSNPKKER